MSIIVIFVIFLQELGLAILKTKSKNAVRVLLEIPIASPLKEWLINYSEDLIHTLGLQKLVL